MVPKKLLALHVYSPLSTVSGPSITSDSSLVKEYLRPGTIFDPSLVQVTEGVGTPLTGHLMVMVVLEDAVTLSPMSMVTGLPSPRGISRLNFGTLIDGFTGSTENSIEYH